MTEDIKIDFQFTKTEISITTAEYLVNKANTTELKDHIQKVISGTSLKLKEANQLLKALFAAIIINDDEGDEIIKSI